MTPAKILLSVACTAYVAGCTYISGMYALDTSVKRKIARATEKGKPDSFPFNAPAYPVRAGP